MAFTETLVATLPPLELRDDGRVLRVTGTRVSLDTVVGAFEQGASPEEIVLRYPSLNLPGVYAVISYYLTHRAELAPYFSMRDALEAESARLIEEHSPPADIRERLLKRMNRPA